MAGRHAVSVFSIFASFTMLAAGASLAKPGGDARSDLPRVPAFADRSRIPASGKQGAPAEAVAIPGNRERGKVLFERQCEPCHGPRGTDKVKNPGSADGNVPPLNPIDPVLAGKTPSAFAANIDRIIQHGSIPDGPNPALFMPNWGDSGTLSQQQIADVEAYIMRLNGARRKN